MTTKAELLRVILCNCKNCMGGYEGEILKCSAPDCELFPYRMGKDPKPNRTKSEIMKKRMATIGKKENVGTSGVKGIDLPYIAQQGAEYEGRDNVIRMHRMSQ